MTFFLNFFGAVGPAFPAMATKWSNAEFPVGTPKKWNHCVFLAQNLDKKRSKKSVKKRRLLQDFDKCMVFDQITILVGFPIARRGADPVERHLSEEFAQ